MGNSGTKVVDCLHLAYPNLFKDFWCLENGKCKRITNNGFSSFGFAMDNCIAPNLTYLLNKRSYQKFGVDA